MFIDVVISLLLLFAFYKGYKKGAVIAIFSFVAVILALYAGLELVGETSKWIEATFDFRSKFLPFISFLLVFIGVILVVRVTAYLIDKFLKLVFLGFVNKLAGGVIGLLIMSVIVSGVIWLFNQIHLISPETKSKSLLFTYVEEVYPFIMGNIPVLKEAYYNLEQIFDEYLKIEFIKK